MIEGRFRVVAMMSISEGRCRKVKVKCFKIGASPSLDAKPYH